MNTASRDKNGNPLGPRAAPFGDFGYMVIYDRHGGVGPIAKPMIDDVPIRDSLMPLLVMAGLLVLMKKKRSVMQKNYEKYLVS